MEIVGALLPIVIGQGIYAIFAGALAKRLNGNTALWVVLSLIPILGMLFLLYVFYRIVAGIIDRLDAINSKLEAS